MRDEYKVDHGAYELEPHAHRERGRMHALKHESDDGEDAELDAANVLGALAGLAAPATYDYEDGDEADVEDTHYHKRLITKPAPSNKEKDSPQKWVQCAKCNLWRRVPYTISDDDIGDDWECVNNIWDKLHASCSIPQELPDEQIDEILAQQAELEEMEGAEDNIEEEEGYDEGEGYEEEAEEAMEGDEGVPIEGMETEEPEVDEPLPREDSDLMQRVLAARGKPRIVRGRSRGGRGSSGNRMGRGPRATRPGLAGPGGRGGPGSRGGRGMGALVRGGAGPEGRARRTMIGRGVRTNPVIRTGSGPVSGPPVAAGRYSGAAIIARPAGGRRGPGGRGARKGGRGRGRVGRGMSEAAEALLGMGSEHADEQGNEGDDQYVEPQISPETQELKACCRPGNVVWAKVEGHDWWPARVVRRRAVPREVGPPPGGPTEVRTHIPVVFYTAKGIPGEVNESMDSMEGAMAAAMRAIKSDNGEENEEAEYAWLPLDCLKKFRPGEHDIQSDDATLLASIEAAELALRSDRAALRASGLQYYSEAESDSDGGWCAPAPNTGAPGTPRLKRGSRGGRGRGRRGRGGRGRGRGRRIMTSFADDDGSGSDSEDAGGTPGGSDAAFAYGSQKIVVEQILGWRWPLSEKQKQSERREREKTKLDTMRKLERMRKGLVSHPPPHNQPSTSSAMDIDANQEANPNPIPNDEADAVAALLSAAAGQLSHEDDAKDEADESQQEKEYLVKWLGKSHVHCEWVPEPLLARIAKRKLINFKRRHSDKSCNFMEEDWQAPERFVARRPSPCGPGWQVLVKWKKLGYEQCTWEVEGERFMMTMEGVQLIRNLWLRQSEAIRRAQPNAQAEMLKLREQKQQHLQDAEAQPNYVAGGKLHGHQLEALNWLRRQWVEGRNVLLADEVGLGKTATVISFLQSLRTEFKCCNPILIVVPSSMLSFWEGEWSFWARDVVNVVPYAGSVAARAVIHDHELWLTPSSMDGKTMHHHRHVIQGKVPKPNVVLTTYEAVCTDTNALKAIHWEVVLVDDRYRVKSVLMKAHQALMEVECSYRMLLMGSLPPPQWDLWMQMLTFLQPEYSDISDLPPGMAEAEEAAQVAGVMKLLEPNTLRRSRPQLTEALLPDHEIWVPSQLSPVQADCYKTGLARFYEILADPKVPRYSGHRAGQMRNICAELRKICSHPCLVPDVMEFEHEATVEEYLEASGKLQLLDRMLQCLRRMGRKVCLVSQSVKMLDILEGYAKDVFGVGCCCRLDNHTPSSLRHKAVEEFNRAHSPAFLFLLSARACGLGTDLPSIDTIIMFDSDWNPRSDLQALRRAYRIGSCRTLTIYRLYIRGLVEERCLMLSEKNKGMEALFKQGPGRSSAVVARALEDILRWGVEDLFKSRYGAEVKAEPMDDAPGGSADEELQESLRVHYSKEAINQLLQHTQQHRHVGENGQPGFGPGLEKVTVKDWTSDKQDDAEATEEGEDVEEGGEEGDGEDDTGDDSMMRGENAEASAHSWETLLKPYWLQLQAEEEEALVQQHQKDDAEGGSPRAPESSTQHSVGEEGEEVNTEAFIGARGSTSLLPGPSGESSDMTEVVTGGRGGRGGRGRGGRGGRGRGPRKRKVEEGESEDPSGSNAGEELKKRRKPAVPVTPDHVVVKSPEEEQLRREWLRHEAVMKAIADPTTPEGAIAYKAYQRIAQITKELGLDPPLVELAHQAAQILLMMRPDNEVPSDFQDYTLIAIVAIAAHLSGLNLGEGHGLPFLANKYKQDTTALEQVFDYIMQSLANYRSMHERLQLMLRNGTATATAPEGLSTMGAVQPAVQAVMAAHETRHGAEAQPEAPSAAAPAALKLDTPTVPVEHAVPVAGVAAAPIPMATMPPSMAPIPVVASDHLDAFQSRLMAILNADYTALAAAAGPLDVSFAPIQGLIVSLSTDETGMKAIEELQRLYQQRTMMSRIHGIRVSHINDEYQKYMERVRAQAQSAIDKANAQWEQSLALLTARIETYIHYLQQHHLVLQQARQQVVAQQVVAQQVLQHVAQQDGAGHVLPLGNPPVSPARPPAAVVQTSQQAEALVNMPRQAHLHAAAVHPAPPPPSLPTAALVHQATTSTPAAPPQSSAAQHPFQPPPTSSAPAATPGPAATAKAEDSKPQPAAPASTAAASDATAGASSSATHQAQAQQASQQPPPLPHHQPTTLLPHLAQGAQHGAVPREDPAPGATTATAARAAVGDPGPPPKMPVAAGGAKAAGGTVAALPPLPSASQPGQATSNTTTSTTPATTSGAAAGALPAHPQQPDASTPPIPNSTLPAAADPNTAMAAYLQQQQQQQLSQQQALLARQLNQPTNLPLKRLTQQAQNQVLSTYQKQQQQGQHGSAGQDKRPGSSLGQWTVQSGQQVHSVSSQGYYYGSYPPRDAPTSQPFTVSSVTSHPTIMQSMAVHIVPHSAQKSTAPPSMPQAVSSSAPASAGGTVRPSVVTGARLPIQPNNSPAGWAEAPRPPGISVQSGAPEQPSSTATDMARTPDTSSTEPGSAAGDTAAAGNDMAKGPTVGTAGPGPLVPPPLPVQGVVVTTGLAIGDRRGSDVTVKSGSTGAIGGGEEGAAGGMAGPASAAPPRTKASHLTPPLVDGSSHPQQHAGPGRGGPATGGQLSPPTAGTYATATVNQPGNSVHQQLPAPPKKLPEMHGGQGKPESGFFVATHATEATVRAVPPSLNKP